MIHPRVAQLASALRGDGASPTLVQSISDGYARALSEYDGSTLSEFRLALYRVLVKQRLFNGAMSLICHPSPIHEEA